MIEESGLDSWQGQEIFLFTIASYPLDTGGFPLG
jgi:hypothetical protein